jgi:hypothetical protein
LRPRYCARCRSWWWSRRYRWSRFDTASAASGLLQRPAADGCAACRSGYVRKLGKPVTNRNRPLRSPNDNDDHHDTINRFSDKAPVAAGLRRYFLSVIRNRGAISVAGELLKFSAPKPRLQFACFFLRFFTRDAKVGVFASAMRMT